jgi:hypothetical protein
MRALLKVMIPTESGNVAIREGTIEKTLEQFMEAYSPEAAYFTLEGGRRCAFFVLDVADPSQMPQIGEPLFMNFGAELDLTPVMNAEELRRGLQALAAAQQAAAH